MRVTLLGTGQLHPADRVQCGTLIEDVPLLVDCGAGVYQRLHESAVDVEELYLTHLPDHTPGERRATVRTIRERFAGNVTVARDVERFSTR